MCRHYTTLFYRYVNTHLTMSWNKDSISNLDLWLVETVKCFIFRFGCWLFALNSSEAWNTQISPSFSFSCVGADFNGVTNYELFPDVGTETGVCKTIKPIVDFNSKLTDPAAKNAFKIELGSEVLSGESNGVNILLDVETFDHGYVPAKGIIMNASCLKPKYFLNMKVLECSWLLIIMGINLS